MSADFPIRHPEGAVDTAIAPGALTSASAPFLLGRCLVEPRELRVQRDGVTLRLEPRVLQVLLALARRNGATITRDELLAEAWPGLVVGDDAIQRAIAKLRAALSADPKATPTIETLPKVGYRLCVAVSPISTSGDLASESPPAAADAGVADDGSVHPPRRVRRWGVLLGLLALGVLVAAVVLQFAPTPLPDVASKAAPVAASSPPAAQWRPLTSEPGMNSGPAFSPDGRNLVFSRGPLLDEKLWIEELASGERRQLTFDAGQQINPLWLPGERIVYLAKQGHQCALMRIDASGGTPHPLSDCGARSLPRPTASPDGRWIAIADAPPGSNTRELFLIDVENGRRRLLLHSPYGAQDTAPSWAPGGEWILYVRNLGGQQREIRRVQPDGSDDQLLASLDVAVRDLVALGEQRWLASTTEPRGGQLLLGEPSREPRSLLRLGEGAHELAVSPDRRRLAVATATVGYSAFRMDLENGAVERLPDYLQGARDMGVSPDAQRVAFVRPSGPDDGVPLWVADITQSEVRLLWSAPGVETTHPVFNPAGDRVAFVRRTPSGSMVCQVALQGEAQCVPDAGARDSTPGFSHDGERLLFTSNRGGVWRPWSAALDGSDAIPLPYVDSGFLLESRDGRFRYLRQIQDNQLLQLVRPEGEPRVLADDVDRAAMHPLLPVPDGVLYFTNQGELRHVDAHSGAARRLANFPTVSPPHFSVTDDGRQLYFTINDQQNADIAVLENLDVLIADARSNASN